jgi:hypothetical protein
MTVSSAPLDLLGRIRPELAPAEGTNRFVPLVASGQLPRQRLAALAGEEYRIIKSDRRSFLLLAARFPEPPAVDFFSGLAHGEGLALGQLMTFAGALGMDKDDLRAYEPLPGCQAYAAYVAWLALNGFFATPVPELERQALAVAQASVDSGAPPEGARRHARLVQAYELMFWNTLAEGGG